jgi:hypothetical protein
MPRPRLVPAALVLWAGALTAVTAQLMRPHWVPLPRPDVADAAWADRVRAAAEPPAAASWTAVHVLNADCECSRRVLRSLAARPPEPGVRERVLWVTDGRAGPDPDPRPVGYDVELVSGGALASRYGVSSAPLLLVLAPDGTPRYSGGYTARKQGPAPRDRAILARVLAGEAPDPLPVFGCPIAVRP